MAPHETDTADATAPKRDHPRTPTRRGHPRTSTCHRET
ncbi:hypothetical protein HMPREF9278_0996 [Mobiluncus mulieris FB024-16]|nr:hypothetical protein HMPREF9278_0996 [Mobiluncus mulieris FB024-16]